MLGTLTDFNPSLGFNSDTPGDLYYGTVLDTCPGFMVTTWIPDSLGWSQRLVTLN